MTSRWQALAGALTLFGCGPASTEPPVGVSTPPPGAPVPPAADPNLGRVRLARHCIDEAQDRDPSVAGKVVVLAKVFADGRVFEAEVAETTLPREVAECIRKHVSHARFDPPGATGTTLTLPFQYAARDAK